MFIETKGIKVDTCICSYCLSGLERIAWYGVCRPQSSTSTDVFRPGTRRKACSR